MYAEEVSLAEYVLVLWRYRLPLLVVAILAGILAFVVGWNRTPTYQASSKLLVSASKIGDGIQSHQYRHLSGHREQPDACG